MKKRGAFILWPRPLSEVTEHAAADAAPHFTTSSILLQIHQCWHHYDCVILSRCISLRVCTEGQRQPYLGKWLVDCNANLTPGGTWYACYDKVLLVSSTNGIPRYSYPIILWRIPAPGRRPRTNISCLHPPNQHHNGLRP